MKDIQEQLKTRWLGRNYIYREEVSSTNDVMKQLADEKAPMGTVVLAETQTAGRGRRGRPWESPQGKGLWFSLLLRPSLSPKEASALTLVTAVGLCRGLDYYPGLGVAIKWPNDILCDGKKLCGILSEMNAEPEKLHYAIIGVGLNLQSEYLSETVAPIAVGIEEILQEDVERGLLLCRLLQGLESAYDEFFKNGFDLLRQEWEERSMVVGKNVQVVTVNGDLDGVALGLSNEGFLRVKLESGKVAHVISGDVHIMGDGRCNHEC
ncbi:MAG: biotin--[acetyl-CoA-carboxylase] ligase [Bacillota bacterium]|nr:biotin--[acetyl-CoA-carboxylase] ligase [Bacillota bacterium]